MRRASMMSVIAPAGRVRRNIGSVVATWTADTIIGSGLRLVMSQFDEVSNIANPTFDAELAISMTVNAKLPKTPQPPAAGASDLAVDLLDNKIPIGRARNRAARPAEPQDQMANNAQSFKAPQCKKAARDNGCGCPKNGLPAKFARIAAAHSSTAAKTVRNTPLSRHRQVRRHELDKFREPVALSEQNFAQLFLTSEQLSLACYGMRK